MVQIFLKSFQFILPSVVISFLKSIYFSFIDLIYKNRLSNNIDLLNIGSHKRCFILGSGPSIKEINIEKLRGEPIIALNSFFLHPDFDKIFEIDNNNLYYLIAPIHGPQKEEEWVKWLKKIDKKTPSNVTMIIGLNYFKGNAKVLIKKHDLFEDKQLYYYYALKNKTTSIKLKDLQITKPILNCETSSLYALIYACNMNFSDIYLVGMDHNYILYDNINDMRFFKNSELQKNEFQRIYGDKKLFYVYEYKRLHTTFLKYYQINKFFKANIFDTSSKGLLKVYRKVKLHEIV